MDKEQLLSAFGGIGDRFIEEAAPAGRKRA